MPETVLENIDPEKEESFDHCQHLHLLFLEYALYNRIQQTLQEDVAQFGYKDGFQLLQISQIAIIVRAVCTGQNTQRTVSAQCICFA